MKGDYADIIMYVNSELSYCNVAFGQANSDNRRKIKRRLLKREGGVRLVNTPRADAN